MAVRSYLVVGEYADPTKFHDYLYDQLKSRRNLHLEAVEQFNELADRRGNPPQQFEVVVKGIHRDTQYLNTVDARSGEWIQIRVGDSEIRFDIID